MGRDGTERNGTERGRWVPGSDRPLCALPGQAQRAVELQRVRPAAGRAEGEGSPTPSAACAGPGSHLGCRLTSCCAPLAAPSALWLIHSVQVYGQGSGLECRRHVQKLNLLQGEAEEALGWTSWYSV